ncbi:MAG: T9SS type A sorting domain-containing protein, partial [Porphyromonadaceae bacterium]|nr:T9SS type A sorting domain-containing protein [Porphyromonadaceae bacterium]
VDVVRASFQPTHPLVNGDLQTAQINDLNRRLNLIDLTGPTTLVALNCDHPSVDPWYVGNAANWAALIDATTKRVQERGRTVITVAPFNEPDFGWGQYTGNNGKSDFFNIAGELRNNPRFDNIRISGGNTLNTDQALPWYNYLKDRLDEGNTHQLAGSFDNYANFFQTVTANGDHGTNDELHNVMEAMVGVEYGMQTGIWWGTAEYARGEFVKASDGVRLAYAEHRPNWTAASVYRNLDNKIQLFGGTSERQAATTTYRFVSKDKDLYFDGYGPQREYTMTLPGGNGYQSGQTNAERVVNISTGEDIQPVIDGQYIIVNRKSGKVMEIYLGNTNSGANVRQNSYSNVPYKHWNVTPVDSRVGGDFSYFSIISELNGKSLDIHNWSLNNGGNIMMWDDTKGGNQQWYLEYAEDGWFYIRSRHSAKCIEVSNASLSDGANILQWEKDGDHNQQWRFIPVDAAVEFQAPIAPVGLEAVGNAESVRLNWTPNTESDLNGYHIFRAESADGPYNTIARNVKSTSFVDNSTTISGEYYYKIKAVDKSLNQSEYSALLSAVTTGANDLVMNLRFEDNLNDTTINLNNASSIGTISYVNRVENNKAVVLNGFNAFLQLPYNVVNQQEITVSTWVYWRGLSNWQRIFDFGNGENEYMFLTPKSGSGQMRFAIKNGGAEQQLNSAAPLANNKWVHVAVTLSPTSAKLYIDGVLDTESTSVTIRPLDFKPVLNYIGRSQFTDPLFNGYVDDFRIYNYALSDTEIALISNLSSGTNTIKSDSERYLSVYPNPVSEVLKIRNSSANNTLKTNLSLSDISGKTVLNRTINQEFTEINVSELPEGVYFLRLNNSKETLIQKVVVKR